MNAREKPLEKKWCPDCRRVYFNDGWHSENCEGPLAPARCGRSVVVMGGRAKAHCYLPSGHEGRCQ